MNTNRPEAWGRLYSAASRLAAYLGAHGAVEAKSDLGHLLVQALDDIDGANYCPGLMPTTWCKRCGEPPAAHGVAHWCENQSFAVDANP